MISEPRVFLMDHQLDHENRDCAVRVLVAGATGAVGRRLVPLLQEAGHGVTAISRSSEGTRWLRAQGAEAVQANIFDADSVHRAVADAAPDAVIHQLTALSGGNPADHRRIRREGTRILVDAAKRAGVARILA
jgi:nucleoside-diphosphate-sugar epimerase